MRYSTTSPAPMPAAWSATSSASSPAVLKWVRRRTSSSRWATVASPSGVASASDPIGADIADLAGGVSALEVVDLPDDCRVGICGAGEGDDLAADDLFDGADELVACRRLKEHPRFLHALL